MRYTSHHPSEDEKVRPREETLAGAPSLSKAVGVNAPTTIGGESDQKCDQDKVAPAGPNSRDYP